VPDDPCLERPQVAVAGLFRSPLFSIVAILSLALGIGANTAIFTLIDQILLRKLPVKPRRTGDALSAGRAQRQQHGIADALVSHVPGVPEAGRAAGRGAVPAPGRGLGERRQPDRALEAEMVSGNFFSMLGVQAAVGAVFNSREDDQVYRASRRRAELRLLDQRFSRDPVGRRQEDPGQQTIR
jgi:hypothetical protein